MPKVVDHEVRRAELVAATWQVIAAEGIDRATVRRVAEAAGCTTGRVTHYFASKEDMLAAALRAVVRTAAARMTAHLDGPDPRAALGRVMHEALPLDDARRTEWLVWLAFWGRAAADARLRREQERHYARWRALLGDMLSRLRPDEPAGTRQAAVDILACGIDGLGLQAVLEPAAFSPRRLERAIDALITAAAA